MNRCSRKFSTKSKKSRIISKNKQHLHKISDFLMADISTVQNKRKYPHQTKRGVTTNEAFVTDKKVANSLLHN